MTTTFKPLPVGSKYDATDPNAGINPATGEKDPRFQFSAEHKYGKDYTAYQAQGGSSGPYEKMTTTGVVGDWLDNLDKNPANPTPTPVAEGESPVLQDTSPRIGKFTGGGVGMRNLEPGEAAQRQVQDEEKTSYQLSQLENSNSKYMQDARRQGLEQANAMGGLGGTVGIGAVKTSALRAALPIAESDAQAYRQAATENLTALNQMAQLNHQRATQIELGRMDSQTRLTTTAIGANAQIAATKLQVAAQRDLGQLDADTKVTIQNMQSTLQRALAEDQFKYDQVLQDAQYAAELARTQMQGEYGLAGTALQKEWDMAIQSTINDQNERSSYTSQAVGIFDSAMQSIASLNGTEMDDAARQRAINSIWSGARTEYDILNTLYPDQDPLEFDWPS